MAAQPSALEIRVLGPLEVLVDGAPLVVDTRKALAILVLLAIEARPFAREELAAVLWPESDDESARGALRRTLSVLRAALGGRFVVVDRSTVRLEMAGVALDVATLDRTGDGSAASLERAAAAARGPFLAGFTLRDSPEFDDWRSTRASAYEQLVADVLARLADARLAAGDPRGATTALRRRLDLDPLDEASHRRLMAALATVGDRTGAIRQYRACAAILERELGVAPLAETTGLYEAILAGKVPEVPQPDAPTVGNSRGQPDSAAAAQAPFVGREMEVARLVTLLGGGGVGSPSLVVTGEAGIGKSRLVDVALKDGDGSYRALVLGGRQGEAGIPYAPLAEAVRTALGGEDGARPVADLAPSVRAELGRIVDLPGDLAVPPPAAGPGGAVRLLEALVTTVVALARGGHERGVLVVDDAGAMDPATLDVVAYLVRRLDRQPLAVVVTVRTDELDGPVLAVVQAVTTAGGGRLALGRLTDEDAAALVRSVRPDADAGTVRAVIEAAEGLPLFLVEAASGRETGPGGIAALLRGRLERVSETAAQVLAAASVLGRSVDGALVRVTAGRSEEEVVDALDELVARGLLHEAAGPGGAPRYAFAHGRLREVAYDRISLARRRLLHRRAADAMRALPEREGGLERWAIIAGHERAAGRDVEAAEAYARAGERAAAVFANREALEDFETALALGHPATVTLRLAIGELRVRLGDHAGAIAGLERAAADADAASAPAIDGLLALVRSRRGELAVADGHLATALGALDAGDPRRTVFLAERAGIALRAGHIADAATYIRDAEGGLGDGPARDRSFVRRIAGLVARAGGDLAAARDALAESLALIDPDVDPAAAVAARNALALVEIEAGGIAAAIGHATAAIADARRFGDRHLEAVVENTLADAHHAAGDVAASREHQRRAVGLFAEVADRGPALEPGIWLLETW